MNYRDTTLDSVKGYAMILMILGHCGLPYILRNPIYSFHMPLFFFITGWFYKPKPLSTVFKTLLKRVLVPFLIVNILTAVYCTFLRIDIPLIYKSIMYVKTSRPIIGGGNWLPGIGPQWFLIAYFFAYIYFYLLDTVIPSKRTELIILLLTFLICDIVARLYGLLPFGIMQGLCASIYIFIGRNMREEEFRDRLLDTKYVRVGVFIWVLCAVVGFLSLASIYNKLSIFQIIGALYGSIIFIWIIKKLPRCRMVENFGRDSLIVLCIHALDIKISSSVISYVFPEKIENHFAIIFLGKMCFVLVVYSVYRYVYFNRKIRISYKS